MAPTTLERRMASPSGSSRSREAGRGVAVTGIRAWAATGSKVADHRSERHCSVWICQIRYTTGAVLERDVPHQRNDAVARQIRSRRWLVEEGSTQSFPFASTGVPHALPTLHCNPMALALLSPARPMAPPKPSNEHRPPRDHRIAEVRRTVRRRRRPPERTGRGGGVHAQQRVDRQRGTASFRALAMVRWVDHRRTPPAGPDRAEGLVIESRRPGVRTVAGSLPSTRAATM